MPEETEIKEGGFDEHEDALPKADVLNRFLAKLIDFIIVGALVYFPGIVGVLAAITYILISDGLMQGRSIGKLVIGLKTVSVETAAPCDFQKSIVRNSVFACLILLYFLIGWIPYLGKLIAVIVAVAVIGFEMVLVYTDESGLRFGDRIAGTFVLAKDRGLDDMAE